MKTIITVALALMSALTIMAQSETSMKLPYSYIESKPETVTAATILARTIDGLGYRYYWATEGLTDDDLIFRPSEDASSVIETLEHLKGLSDMVLNAINNKPNVRGVEKKELSYSELRASTLTTLKEASDILVATPDMDLSAMTIQFQRGDNTSSFDIWHLMNGPLADAIYHTGQIVSFRRTNENPVNPKMNVFMGKNRQ